jgi:hypothetical protein
MYWLMAVNSSDNREFNVPRSFSFPFIDVTSGGVLKGLTNPRDLSTRILMENLPDVSTDFGLRKGMDCKPVQKLQFSG